MSTEIELSQLVTSEIPLESIEALEVGSPKKRCINTNIKAYLHRNACMVLSTLLLVVILVVGTIIIADESVHLKHANDSNSSHSKPAAQDAVVQNSREYQIKLADLHDWGNRDSHVQDWAKVVTDTSAYLDFSSVLPSQYVRNQYNIDAKVCKNKNKFRVRDYVEGASHQTIDIKANSDADDYDTARNFPFWPSTEAFKTLDSFQKCENDVHHCNQKYSRETRVTYDEPENFATCADLIRLYPWAFPQLDNDNLFLSISTTDFQYWWMGKYTGTIGNTNYEVEITLQYNSIEEASSGVIPKYGEWSIRIFTLDGGLSEQFEADVVADVENVWHTLEDTFGNAEEFEEGCEGY